MLVYRSNYRLSLFVVHVQGYVCTQLCRPALVMVHLGANFTYR